MNPETTLVSKLNTISGLTVYAIQAPEKAVLPYVTYQEVSAKSFLHHKGVINTKRYRYQLRFVSSTYAELMSVLAQAEAILDGNNQDFQVSYPSDLSQKTKEARDIYTCLREYFIFN